MHSLMMIAVLDFACIYLEIHAITKKEEKIIIRIQNNLYHLFSIGIISSKCIIIMKSFYDNNRGTTSVKSHRNFIAYFRFYGKKRKMSP